MFYDKLKKRLKCTEVTLAVCIVNMKLSLFAALVKGMNETVQWNDVPEQTCPVFTLYFVLVISKSAVLLQSLYSAGCANFWNT